VLLYALSQSYLHVFRDGEAVDDHFDIMDLIPIDLHFRREVFYFSVDAHFQITFLADIFEEFAIMAFAAADEGSENGNLFVLQFPEHVVDDLFFAEFDHLLTGIVRMGLADTGVEEAKKVIDLGDRADGTAGILIGRLLFDGDDGAEAGNFVTSAFPYHR